MLYAVSVETSRTIRHGRMRRRERVYVDARDGDEARRLALQRFRHLRRDAADRPRIAIGAVRAVSLEKPQPPRVVSKAPLSKPTKPRRPKRRQRKRGASTR